MTTFKFNREKDKGFYSDHTYESPVCDNGIVAGRGNTGYHTVNLSEVETDVELNQNRNTDTHSKPAAHTGMGTLSYLMNEQPGDINTQFVPKTQ